MTDNLITLFDQLLSSQINHEFIAIEIPNNEGIYLAISSNKLPHLFVNADSRIIEAPLKTAYITLIPNWFYCLTLSDGSKVEKFFHMIKCSSNKGEDIITFLSLLQAFIEQSPGCKAASANISFFFRDIMRLFSIQPAIDKASERQGLWGELFVMRSVRGYSFWAPYWHNVITDVFDFSTNKKRLEVKTSASGQRIHFITHQQVYARFGEEIILASLIVHEDQTSLCLRDLINECKTAFLGSKDYIKIEKAARHAGMCDAQDTGPSFSLLSAQASLAFYRSEDIPHFDMPEPPGVSQTSFRADLSSVPKVDMKWLDLWIKSWQSTSKMLNE